MGVWDNVGENQVIKLLNPNAQLCELKYLEPFFTDEPWSKYLENKKVLLIHPFEQTIIAQYQKRQNLFTNPDTLSSFELLTIKAVQSLSAADENYHSWHEALLRMDNQIDAKEFDVAIIGANAVVAGHIPPYAIAVGNPAKVLKYRFRHEVVAQLLEAQWWNWGIEQIIEYDKNFHG